ncbi:MAG TPA: M1 family metallopeptidase [Gemmatimonadota bacterium]|nr:M1 family metallopeptidase [Gemmatimonadota bacterium]
MPHRFPIVLATLLAAAPAFAQDSEPEVYTRADTLRGDWTTPGRAWWDVTFYDLHIAIDPPDSAISGYNAITYRVLQAPSPPEIQIDLMEPLAIDSIVQGGRSLAFRREGNAYFATVADPAAGDAAPAAGELETITVWYGGKPKNAPRPPWDGGFTWTTDSLGRPWIVTTDQGMGASVFWPNKDTQADEPDSQRFAVTVPDPLIDVSNGRLRSTTENGDGSTTYEWFVTNPINNYAITVAAANYAHYSDTLAGEAGPLTMDFWPLDYHLDAARRQFPQAETTLACFEGWFGPYPWYEDGYKLVETPHPGMEHQSAVAYGNYYANGYRGRDASGVGIGLQFDFIIVHETAHEWWGNNISTKDLADMWVHESFGNYAENLFVECTMGKEQGAAYVIGTRRGIDNDRPIVPMADGVPAYGVNAQGSGDMYPKGGNMLHTIRQIVGDDEKWRGILRGLQETFGGQTVMGSDVEGYVARESGVDLTRVFDQYLRTTMIPALEYRIEGRRLSYRWANVVPGFAMPIEVRVGGKPLRIQPTEEWRALEVEVERPEEFEVDPDYYVQPRDVSDEASEGNPATR